MIRKCNFGCGSIVAPGWHNVDLQDFGQQFIGSTELFKDSYFDIIVAHCSLQMVEWHDLPKVLKDLRRILKPDGILRISLPNIVQGFKEYAIGNIDWFPNGEEDLDERFSSWLTWYSSTKTLLTYHALRQLLFAAGFIGPILLAPFKETKFQFPEIVELDTREHECYFMEARK